ncbi:3-phosphoshikimate 1-carboxyvinyltransferase [Thermomonas sp.]|uniref:3-phosphoshikimate 1-carboxyvinyltransferase n=1 Tax=Thermomonas sp. TaxID=1971895 RepID=UPI00248824DE|nr:3-phosphoshikimate 1-carboxyvinyltransferase [Thermomonas sp.]MDI1253465.1 3-phosphoshikimate 1-carboxyvinyltransferase [Thermomonas sp.]
MTPVAGWIAGPGSALQGEVIVPGDKSVSHRAIMLGAIAEGVTRIVGFLEGEDTRATAAIFRQLGVHIEAPSDGVRIVHGVGLHGLQASQEPLDCGNAGTAMRLLTGLLAGQAFDSTLVGDASLSQRPMRRVIDPLAALGAHIDSNDGRAPLRIHGDQPLRGSHIDLVVASAQLKSAVLLAGLYADGETRVSESHPTRDYTERMLTAFGAPCEFAPGVATIRGDATLHGTEVHVPADFSSAAFFLAAATLVPGSDLVLRQVGMNPRRTGLLHVLRMMGANIVEETASVQGGEPVCDLRVRHAPLHGIEVPVELVPDMIDEFPVLFVAAACAQGTTSVRGAAELRVKESDRIAVMAAGLRTLGIRVDETPDGATIHGGKLHGGAVESHGDHRIAMAFAVAAQLADGEVSIGDVANVATSFPGFDDLARDTGFALRDA